MNKDTISATHAVSCISTDRGGWWVLRVLKRLTNPGLYHKLHGIPRPSTMKKSVIKRRKRVIPVSHEVGAEASTMAPAEPIQSPSPPHESSERGSKNPDGSMNLGVRKNREQHGLQLVPETLLRQNSLPPMNTAATLTQYSVYNKYHSEIPQSLDDDHRLAPLGITSLATPSDRQTSLSPASFLSPTRKRSLAEINDRASPSSTEPDSRNNKRLSSIQTLLNSSLLSAPAGSARPVSPRITSDETLAQLRAYLDSPPRTIASVPSPGAYSNSSSSAGPTHPNFDTRRPSIESETSKCERRAVLERESRQIRERLAANERELAKLGNMRMNSSFLGEK